MNIKPLDSPKTRRRLLSLSGLILSAALLHAVNIPSGGGASPAGPAAIALSWEDNSLDETGFEIYSNGLPLVVLDPDTTYYYDRGLTPETSYSYEVRALGSPDSAWHSLGTETTTPRYNILFFLADDMGYKDIVALRNPAIDGPTIHETPELDSLVGTQAVSFTNAYCSGPRCVVARRSMQTGMYDWRPEATPTNDYYLDIDGSPNGGGIYAGGTTVAGAKIGAGQPIPDNVTYGEALQAAGYRTCFIGKFHLGESDDGSGNFGDSPARGPDVNGYDVSIAAGHAGAPPVSYFAQEDPDNPGTYTYWLPNLDDTGYMLPGDATPPYDGEYLTERLTKKAIGFMDDAVTNHSSQPFCLTLAHYAVHTPMEARPADITYFKNKKAAMAAELATHPMAATPLITDYSSKTRMIQDNTVYAAMMKSYDESLASLRAYLEATDDPRHPGKKLSETTILVVSSDHGGKSTTAIEDNKPLENDATDPVNPEPIADPGEFPPLRSAWGNAYSSYPTSNYPFRQGKTWVYEGGIKVPMIVHYPGLTTTSTRSDAFVHHADMFATFVDMAGGSLTALPDFPDGSSQTQDTTSFMLSVGQPGATGARDTLLQFFSNANTGTANPALGAIRKGDYKLLYFMVQRKVELYNLEADPYEQNDLAASRPDLAAEMLDELYQGVLDTGYTMPRPGSNSWRSEQEVLVANNVIGSLPAPPDAAPDNLTLTQLSETAIQLDWNVNATNATHSIIYRDGYDEDSYREIAVVPVTQTTYVDTAFTSVVGEKYKYRIESENLGGWNGWTIDPGGLFSDGSSNNGTTNTGNIILTLAASPPRPAMANDDTITTVPGELRIFNPLLNDSGEGELVILSVGTPTSGTAYTDGKAIYYGAPEAFSGGVTLTYIMQDAAFQSDSATATINLPVAGSSVNLVECWNADDADSGDGLQDLTNIGTWNSPWNFNTTAQNDVADGNGLFVLNGASTTITRKAPPGNYAVPATSGKFRLEITFDSWNADPASLGDYFQIKINNTAGNLIAKVAWEVTSASGTEIQFDSFDFNGHAVAYSLAESTPVTAAAEFDFDADTIEYLIDGAVVQSFPFTGDNIGQVVYVKRGDGTGDWVTAATTVKVDAIRLIEFATNEAPLYNAYASAYPWMGVRETASTGDPDLDGMTNLFEFAFGTDLLAPSPHPIGVNGSGLFFTPVRDTSAITYEVLRSVDLVDWTSIAPVMVTSPAGQPVQVPLPGPFRGFGRVQVSE